MYPVLISVNKYNLICVINTHITYKSFAFLIRFVLNHVIIIYHVIFAVIISFFGNTYHFNFPSFNCLWYLSVLELTLFFK